MTLMINGIDVETSTPIRPGSNDVSYVGLGHKLTTLPKGFRQSSEHAPFKADTVFEKDLAVMMRDGVTLRCDVFRPAGVEKVPAIIMWSPYGKGGNGPHGLHMLPGRFGVPQSWLSGFEKFEGLDPAEWTEKGYGIVNFDLRGAWDSEGTLPWLGSQDGRDGYDAVEFVAQQEWCTGKVAIAGNSWLAMSQYFIAAEQPPHLFAIAPWEGACDFYRDTLCRGGVPYPYQAFWSILNSMMYGRGECEDLPKMLTKFPLFNEYWQDKVARLEDIQIPTYLLASYSTALHTSGSIRAFRKIGTNQKWLRIHSKQEWSDLYDKSSIDELQKFMDCYLKDQSSNGWANTPRVQVSLLPFNREPITNIPDEDYPLRSTKYNTLYLEEGGKLLNYSPTSSSQASYDSEVLPGFKDDDSEELTFAFAFSDATWLAGYSKATLYMSCAEHDDMDVFVQLRKVDKSGKVLQHMNVPLQNLVPAMARDAEVPDSCFYKYLGPTGVLRASHAGSKVAGGEDFLPEYAHDAEKKVVPGTVVKLEVPIWPAGMAFDAGESLMLKVGGHPMNMMEFPGLGGTVPVENKGRHVLHFGGEKASHLTIPLVAPRP